MEDLMTAVVALQNITPITSLQCTKEDVQPACSLAQEEVPNTELASYKPYINTLLSIIKVAGFLCIML